MRAKPGGNRYGDQLALAAQFFKVSLRRHTSEKASGPCPRCGGEDRFVVWVFEGSGWCSRCKYVGYFMDRGERREVAEEERLDKLARQAELRLRMADCQDWHTYHEDIEHLPVVWEGLSVSRVAVRRWGLGWCAACPTAPEYASATIPVFYDSVLRDIRHKLLDVPAQEALEVGKYRSHLSGLVPFPFNLDALTISREILVIEGELKPIRLMEDGPDGEGLDGVIGIPGVHLVDDLLAAASLLQDGQTVTIGLDPGADQAAEQLAYEFTSLGVETRIADFFMKPDDIRLQFGIGVVREVLRQSRRVR